MIIRRPLPGNELMVGLLEMAARGDFNGLPPVHEPKHFCHSVILSDDPLVNYRYDARRAYECWLKTGNPELGGR